MSCIDLPAYAEAVLDDLMRSHPLKARPLLIWKSALRVTAGMAYYRVNTIGLSKNLLIDENRLRATLVHEYAHLLAFERHGRKGAGHGEPWRQAMRDLGAEPQRTHCYEVQRNAARQQVTYVCQKCGLQILRSRRLPRFRRYVHASCGGGLRLLSVKTVTNRLGNP